MGAALFVALGAVAPRALAADPDPWFGPDKPLHFGLSVGLAERAPAKLDGSSLLGEIFPKGRRLPSISPDRNTRPPGICWNGESMKNIFFPTIS